MQWGRATTHTVPLLQQENLHGIDRTFVIADAEIDGDPKLTPEYPKR